jgi:hypothetical protein
MKKKLSSQIFYEKTRMRAYWSQSKKRVFFAKSILRKRVLDIFKMSIFDFPKIDLAIFFHFFHFIKHT